MVEELGFDLDVADLALAIEHQLGVVQLVLGPGAELAPSVVQYSTVQYSVVWHYSHQYRRASPHPAATAQPPAAVVARQDMAWSEAGLRGKSPQISSTPVISASSGQEILVAVLAHTHSF